MPRAVVVDPRFGARLRALRRERGLSLRQLAELVPCSHVHITEIEHGTKRPGPTLACRLETVLDAAGTLAGMVRPPQAVDVPAATMLGRLPAGLWQPVDGDSLTPDEDTVAWLRDALAAARLVSHTLPPEPMITALVRGVGQIRALRTRTTGRRRAELLGLAALYAPRPAGGGAGPPCRGQVPGAHGPACLRQLKGARRPQSATVQTGTVVMGRETSKRRAPPGTRHRHLQPVRHGSTPGRRDAPSLPGVGLRLAVLHESDAGRSLAEGTVKRLTGGDRIKARRMREDFWSFDPSHTFVMLTNHKPIVAGTDEGIWRRLRLVPWNVVIPGEERDDELGDRLALEADAVLLWLVTGYQAWKAHGLDDPEAVTAATAAYRAESDAVARFLDECCLRGPHYSVRSKELFSVWSKWCASQGEQPGTATAFTLTLQNRGLDPPKKTMAANVWRGIGLAAEDE